MTEKEATAPLKAAEVKAPKAKKVPPQTVPQPSAGLQFMRDVIVGMKITVKFTCEQESAFEIAPEDFEAVCRAIGDPEVPAEVGLPRKLWKASKSRTWGA